MICHRLRAKNLLLSDELSKWISDYCTLNYILLSFFLCIQPRVLEPEWNCYLIIILFKFKYQLWPLLKQAPEYLYAQKRFWIHISHPILFNYIVPLFRDLLRWHTLGATKKQSDGWMDIVSYLLCVWSDWRAVMRRECLPLLDALAHFIGYDPVGYGHDAGGHSQNDGEDVDLVDAPERDLRVVPLAPVGLFLESNLKIGLE